MAGSLPWVDNCCSSILVRMFLTVVTFYICKLKVLLGLQGVWIFKENQVGKWFAGTSGLSLRELYRDASGPNFTNSPRGGDLFYSLEKGLEDLSNTECTKLVDTLIELAKGRKTSSELQQLVKSLEVISLPILFFPRPCLKLQAFLEIIKLCTETWFHSNAMR